MWLHVRFIKFGGSKVRAKHLPREPNAVARPTRGHVLRRCWAAWRLWRQTRRGWRGRGCAGSCCAGASLAQHPLLWRRSERWTEPAASKNSHESLQRLHDEWKVLAVGCGRVPETRRWGQGPGKGSTAPPGSRAAWSGCLSSGSTDSGFSLAGGSSVGRAWL